MSVKEQVLELFKKKRGGMTVLTARAELSELHPHTVTSAVNALVKENLLVDSGKRAKPPPDQGGRPSIVYKYQKPAPPVDLSEEEIREQEEQEHDQDPKNYFNAFQIRADQARVFAWYPQDIKITKAQRKTILDMCSLVENAWRKLRERMGE